MTIFNVHYFGLPRVDISRLCGSLTADAKASAADPLNFVSFALGDWNLRQGLKFDYKNPSAPIQTDNSIAGDPLLRGALGRYTELDGQLPTRYSDVEDCARKLDTIFTSLPSALIPLSRWSVTIPYDAKNLFRSGLSDHAPVIASVSTQEAPSQQNPIPPEIIKHWSFSLFFCKMYHADRLDQYKGFEGLQIVNDYVRGAAELARSYIRTVESESAFASALTLTAIARVLWMQDHQLARAMIGRDAVASRFLAVQDDVVSLREPVAFSQLTDQARGSLCTQRHAEAQRSGASEAKLSALSRRSKLWIPHSKRLILRGVALNDEIIRSEPARSIALGNSWQSTFDKKAFDASAAQEFLNHSSNLANFSNPQDTNIFHMYRAIWKGKNTHPGPNGIPAIAYRFCPRAPSLFLEVDSKLKSGADAPLYFNMSLGWFPPKGDFEGDHLEVIRQPSDTRPLAGKNSDNKAIVSANVLTLARQYNKIVHKDQRGFVSGRNMLGNLIDIDAAGRIFSTKFAGAPPSTSSLVKNFPVISSNDFGAAFPSIIHDWIWMVLRHRELPEQFIVFFQAIYKNATAVTWDQGKWIVIIYFLSGVLQGCPASAMLFNLALDPFLAAFECALEFGRKGIVRACADDIAFALSRLSHLRVLFPIYDCAQHIAGLSLKPKKCKIVPCIEISHETLTKVNSWVRKHIPQWGEFEAKGFAELLGFFVGPLAGPQQWLKPLSKFSRRIHDMKYAGASINMNTYDYNSRALPVLSYVAQLVPLPASFAMEQRRALHVVHHAPFNTFAHSELFQVSHFGLPVPRCGIAATASALMRAALKTVTHWQDWIPQMHQVTLEHISTRALLPGGPLLYPRFWDAPSFAENLQWAARGFFSHPELHAAGIKAILELQGGVAINSDYGHPPPGLTKSPKECPNHVQKRLYKSVFDSLHSPLSREDLDLTLRRRINYMFAPFEISFFSSVTPEACDDCPSGSSHMAPDAPALINLDECFAALRLVGVADRAKVMKTWLHGWATSHRIKGDFLHNCLLGCDDSIDGLSHYLQCPRMYAVCKFVWSDSPSCPLERCGLKNPSKLNLLMSACAFGAYHALKNKIRSRVYADPFDIDYRANWTFFAQSFLAEAVERSLVRKLFSSSEFNEFLNLL